MCRSLVALFLLLLSPIAAAESPARLPRVIIDSPRATGVAWVALCERPTTPCAKERVETVSATGHDQTLPAVTDRAHSIFAGSVFATEQGILLGQPGTMVAVSVTGSVKGRFTRDDIVMLFYPLVGIRLEEGALCSVMSGGPIVPRRGDVVVAFPAVASLTETPIFHVDAERQVIVVRDGRAHLPENLADELDERASAEEILRAVFDESSVMLRGCEKNPEWPASGAPRRQLRAGATPAMRATLDIFTASERANDDAPVKMR